MATELQTNASVRMVVLLRPAEKKRVQKIAKRERVSSGEIIRRSLDAYDTAVPAESDAMLSALVVQMNAALDEALATVRSTRLEVTANLKKVRQMELQAGRPSRASGKQTR